MKMFRVMALRAVLSVANLCEKTGSPDKADRPHFNWPGPIAG